MKEPRQVMVLHKCGTDAHGPLAVGQTFEFPNTKDRYTVQENGSVVNADPKPYRTKAERKKYLRARRQQRQDA